MIKLIRKRVLILINKLSSSSSSSSSSSFFINRELSANCGDSKHTKDINKRRKKIQNAFHSFFALHIFTFTVATHSHYY